MIGVSPAFFFSLYTTGFTSGEYCKGLDILARLGFEAYQPEVYNKEKLPEWLDNARCRYGKGCSLGLVPTQFVAHFMIDTTDSDSTLFSDIGIDEMYDIIDIVSCFKDVDTITIPIGPYLLEKKLSYMDRWKRLCEKISVYCDIASGAGLKIALEIIPKSLIGNTDGLIRLIDSTDKENLGLNFDTGHLFDSGEILEIVPSKLRGRIWGTHLKDVGGSVIPGRGTIDWRTVIYSLRENGYDGSLDLELALSGTEQEICRTYLEAKKIICSYK